MALPAQIERYNERMADCLCSGHESPRCVLVSQLLLLLQLRHKMEERPDWMPSLSPKYIVIDVMEDEQGKRRRLTWRDEALRVYRKDDENAIRATTCLHKRALESIGKWPEG